MKVVRGIPWAPVSSSTRYLGGHKEGVRGFNGRIEEKERERGSLYCLMALEREGRKIL